MKTIPFYRFYPKSEKVYVYYSSLNFKDVMIATGKLCLEQPNDPRVPEVNIGIEYAGITTSGRRVMGIIGCEGLGLQILTDLAFTWDVPKEWSLDEAATVPCVYATVSFLFETIEIMMNFSVLLRNDCQREYATGRVYFDTRWNRWYRDRCHSDSSKHGL